MVELAEELNLPYEEWMQDYPREVINHCEIDKYIDHYITLIDEDKKFVLMEGIIQATEEQETEELFTEYWHKIKPLLEKDFAVHEYTIYYWSCLDDEDIDCWKITPLIRQLWNEKYEKIF